MGKVLCIFLRTAGAQLHYGQLWQIEFRVCGCKYRKVLYPWDTSGSGILFEHCNGAKEEENVASNLTSYYGHCA